MKKLLILGILFATAPIMLRADGVDTAQTGTPISVRADASGTAPAARKVKKHHKRKIQARTIALYVTGDGFVPSDIKVKRGVPVNLVVTRRTDQTCATSIVIPAYGLSGDLPLNVPVTLSFTPKNSGNIRYSCGMGMIQGALSVE